MSEQETAVPAGPPVGGMGLAAVPLLLTSPSEAFRRLGADPKWVGQFVLVLVLIAVASWVRMPQDLVLQYDTTSRMLEKMGADDAKIDQALARIPDPEAITAKDVLVHLGPGVAAAAAFSFLGVLVFWVIARLSGPQPGWSRASAVYWTAHVASAAGYLALALLVRATNSVEVSLSPAALVPGLEWGSVPYLLLNIFDVFSVATLYLLATGARRTFPTSGATGWVIAGTYWTLASLLGFASQLAGSWAMGRL